MKNKVSDVRNHLVAVMEALNDEAATPEQQAAAIERAKAMSSVAAQYIGAVRVELDAVRLYDDTRMLPSVFETPVQPEARVLSFDPRQRTAA